MDEDNKKTRGRPRRTRRVGWTPEIDIFKPRGVPAKKLDEVTVTVEEMEAIRLVDKKGHTQTEAAEEMNISRRSLWNDLNSGRRKIAEALTTGKKIIIKGGNYSTKK